MAALCLAAGGALVGGEDEVVTFCQRAVDARMGRAPEGECRQSDGFGDVERAGVAGQQQVGLAEDGGKLQEARLAGN